MSNEWFYIRRWKEAVKPNWVIVDRDSRKILQSNMVYHEAEQAAIALEDRNKNKVFVVNVADPLYTEIASQQEGKSNVNS